MWTFYVLMDRPSSPANRAEWRAHVKYDRASWDSPSTFPFQLELATRVCGLHVAMNTWQSVWEQTQPSLQSARETLANLAPIHSRILRVGQLDAELLDEELVHVLQEPIGKALAQIRVGLSIAS